MVFKLFVATDAGKVRNEIIAAACFAFERRYRAVLLMGMFACTARPPRVNVESFSPWQPPLSELLGPPRDEPEKFTRARLAATLEFSLRKQLLMVFEEVSTETPGFRSHSEAVFFG